MTRRLLAVGLTVIVGAATVTMAAEATGSVTDARPAMVTPTAAFSFGAVVDVSGQTAAAAPLPPETQLSDGGGVSSASLGIASWYSDGPGLYAAVPGWQWGDTPYKLRVCHAGKCVTVTVRDACRCPGDRLIDLSRDAFRQLAPLSTGLIMVTVTGGAAAGPLPATSTIR